MTAQERRKKFDELASQLWAIRQELEKLQPELNLRVDQIAIRDIMTNLTWATENCSVVGKHQVGRLLDDNMGIPKDAK